MQDFDASAGRLRDEKQGAQVLTRGGQRLLLSARGARVMAVGAQGVPCFPFYLADDGAGELGGGDRLWLGPEVAWFWPSLGHAREDPVKHARVPGEVDPGVYGAQGHPGGGAVTLRAEMDLRDARDGRRLRLEVERSIRLLDPPGGLPEGVAGVGYATTHRLRVQNPEGEPGPVASAWSIAQVPPGGTLVCPTPRRLSVEADVTSYYDDFGPDHVRAGEDAVRFVVDARRRVKMGLKAEDTTGRMGYLRPLGDGRASLILRFFPAHVGESYCDVPRSADAGVRSGGDCLQAYNDDLTYGAFGEMEHHDPAVAVGGVQRQAHASTTLILAGPDPAVRAHGSRLLGARL